MTSLEELQQLPAQPVSVLRVLELVDDPNASTADLARLVETDPALSAQVMRLANSAYYGLSGTVASANRAVVLLGFTTVRALAVTAVCTLLEAHDDPFAGGFWPHAIATAVSSSVLARRVGVAPSDAFSAGLLHDLGVAVLRRRDAEAYEEVLASTDGARHATLAAERRLFATTHPEAGAEVLRAWKLPPAFVRAVEQHHRPLHEVHGPLSRVVVAGEAMAQLIDDTFPYEPQVDAVAALAHAGGRDLVLRDLLGEARVQLDALARFLEVER